MRSVTPFLLAMSFLTLAACSRGAHEDAAGSSAAESDGNNAPVTTPTTEQAPVRQLCGATYAEFVGGDCPANSICVLGEAGFPEGPDGTLYYPASVGICHPAEVACHFGGDACPAGKACTYISGETEGRCRAPGTTSGLCGGTYADFVGGECAEGLTCELGKASFPLEASGPASHHPETVGVCVQ